jgi:hypothetical protein
MPPLDLGLCLDSPPSLFEREGGRPLADVGGEYFKNSTINCSYCINLRYKRFL